MTYAIRLKLTIVTSFLSLCMSTSLLADEGIWSPEGFNWYYDYYEFGAPPVTSYIRYQNEGDTIIEGEEAVVLAEKQATSEGEMFLKNHYMYEENGIVYLLTRDGFQKVFDLNASPDDSWNLPLPKNEDESITNYCSKDSEVIVKDTGRVIINGQTLKKLAVEYHITPGPSGETQSFNDTIIEKIGPLNFQGYLSKNLENCSSMDAPRITELRCYEDIDLGLYEHTEDSCDHYYKPDYNEIANTSPDEQDIYLFPNPASDRLYIQGLPHNAEKVFFYNIDHTKRHSIPIEEHSAKISLTIGDLKPGQYIVTIKDSEYNMIFSDKLIKI